MGNNTNNKQSQNVKVIVNNTIYRRKRRNAPSKDSQEAPDISPTRSIPFVPMRSSSKGIPAYPIRPANYAPAVQMIQPEGGLRDIPSYFERQFTNQQSTLEQMRRNIEANIEYMQNLQHDAPQETDSMRGPSSDGSSLHSGESDETWKTDKLNHRQIQQLKEDIEKMQEYIDARYEAKQNKNTRLDEEYKQEMRKIARPYGLEGIKQFGHILKQMKEKLDRIDWSSTEY